MQPALQDEPHRSRKVLGPSLAENRPKKSGQTAFRHPVSTASLYVNRRFQFGLRGTSRTHSPPRPRPKPSHRPPREVCLNLVLVYKICARSRGHVDRPETCENHRNRPKPQEHYQTRAVPVIFLIFTSQGLLGQMHRCSAKLGPNTPIE